MTASSVIAKAKILSRGLHIGRETLEYLSQLSDYKSESFVYNNSHWELGGMSSLCPQELMLMEEDGSHETVTSCIVTQDSTLSLRFRDDRLIVYDSSDSDIVSDVQVHLLPRPTFWEEMTPDGGHQIGRLLSTCGLCEANVWLWHECMLPILGMACKFCGINSTARERTCSDFLSVAELSKLHSAYALWESRKEEVLNALTYGLQRALDTYEPYRDHLHLVFICGNLSNELLDLQWQIHVEAMEALNNAGFILKNLDSTAILMPPNDLGWLERARDAGLGVVGFNLEVWDAELFRRYCPGKAQYGRQRMLEALREAVRIFGSGSVWSNFVLGLEPESGLLCGMEYLLSEGIVPGANVFHKDKGAQLGHLPVPSAATLMRFYRRLANLYHEYGFAPFYCEKALRTSLANEAFKGWLE